MIYDNSVYFPGEYISLYHHQRALLQQRELQKNDYIAHLAKDREEMSVCINGKKFILLFPEQPKLRIYLFRFTQE